MPNITALLLLAVALLLLAAGTIAQNSTATTIDCEAVVLAAVDEGNCSAVACPDSCVQSLAQIPVYCVWAAANYSITQGMPLSQLQADVNACGYRKFFTINTTDAATHFDTGTSTTTIVQYLIGICIGAVLMSAVFIILMAAPMLLSQAIGAPTVLVAKGKQAARQGKAAPDKGRHALVNSSWGEVAQNQWNSAVDALGGSFHGAKNEMAVAATEAVPLAPTSVPEAKGMAIHVAHKATAEAKKVVVEVGEAAAWYTSKAAESSERAIEELQHSLVDEGPGSTSAAGSGVQQQEGEVLTGTPKTLASGLLEVVSIAHSSAARTQFIVWAFLAGALYIAAVVLLIIGTLQFVTNSVAAYSLTNHNNDGALVAIEWLIIGLLIVTGACDVLAVYIVMAANKEQFTLWRLTFRNLLFSRWVNRHTYKIHVFVAGLVTLVLTIACILFGLGLVVVILQLIVQLFCAEVDNLSINGTPINDVCINMPTSEVPICGFGALELCYDITSMGVLSLVLGAALLLWSHIIWFTLLLVSMWRFLAFNVIVANHSTKGGFGTSLSAPQDTCGSSGSCDAEA